MTPSWSFIVNFEQTYDSSAVFIVYFTNIGKKWIQQDFISFSLESLPHSSIVWTLPITKANEIKIVLHMQRMFYMYIKWMTYLNEDGKTSVSITKTRS